MVKILVVKMEYEIWNITTLKEQSCHSPAIFRYHDCHQNLLSMDKKRLNMIIFLTK